MSYEGKRLSLQAKGMVGGRGIDREFVSMMGKSGPL